MQATQEESWGTSCTCGISEQVESEGGTRHSPTDVQEASIVVRPQSADTKYSITGV